ncbi:hypothetical protein [Alkalihalophilus pseudofirmus]|jgi:hypothetical protein|uniref:hypothetical protein n=1 Tax=Alkalihalophilus pseudofirmus TaxID=79885 RepID=UPI0004299F37|nr:hypothetical protein [Alkalihalophilus pseudofirmus]
MITEHAPIHEKKCGRTIRPHFGHLLKMNPIIPGNSFMRQSGEKRALLLALCPSIRLPR